MDPQVEARPGEAWPDERVVEWDGNFRSDGVLMLRCCERDVDIEEYRRVLERHIEFRDRHTL